MVKKRGRTSRKRHTVAILYHYLTKRDQKVYPDREHVMVDQDTDHTVKLVATILSRHGFTVRIVRITRGSLRNLKYLKAQYVYNLVDSRALEVRIARILDRLQIPHSGSSVGAIRTSNDKIRTKRVFTAHGLPIPLYRVLRLRDRLTRGILPSAFPLIVKPAFEHCSIGISNQSIAVSFAQLKRIVRSLREKYHQALLLEEFIAGEELQVTVYENGGKTIALPPAQITWKGRVRNPWNIYGFDEKWDRTSALWKSCQFAAPPRRISERILTQIKKESIRAFYAMGFRDYARFDLRYRPKTRQWYFLEANANAGISAGAGDATTASLRAAGMKIDDFVLQIVRNAIR